MNETRILIVDDEPDIRDIISDILSDEGYRTFTAENAGTARAVMREQNPHLVLLDIWMPDLDGITLLKEWMDQDVDASVVMISGHGTVDTAVEAIRIGAYDFLEKPLSTAKLLVTVERALRNRQLTEENLQLKSRLEPSMDLLGDSPAITTLRHTIERFASTDSWILIHGEPGSGKDVTAQLIHRHSRRKDGPYVDVNLGAIPAENLAVHLFGLEQEEDITEGSLERASGGTLVLDEVADLSAELQAKLLSALVERSFFRVGGRAAVNFDVRVISTTNQDLAEKVNRGEFRRDLYDRLNQLPIEVPPLRSHREDVPMLVNHIVRQAAENEGLERKRFSTTALNALRNYSWPGNVRELNNLVRRLMITAEDEEIGITQIRTALGETPALSDSTSWSINFDTDLREAREAFEREYLLYHLEQVQGNMTELASRTGLERTHLYRKLKGLGIDPKSGKRS